MTSQTPEGKIEEALERRLAGLVLSPTFDIAWPGMNFPGKDAQGNDKPLPQRFLKVEHDAINVARPFLSTTSRHRGSFFVSVCVPLDFNPIQARDLAGAVANRFPADHEETLEGVKVSIVERPTVAGAYKDEQFQRWRTPVVIPYEAWLQAS